MSIWNKTRVESFEAWTGETERMRVVVVPSLGAKTLSLVDKRSGREWLYRSPRPLGNLGYGTSFADGDGSGWDEMFPSVNACAYPAVPWCGREVPDHGEVWALAWSHEGEKSGEALRCAVSGVRFPYRLEKTYVFPAADRLRIEYRAVNLSDAPLPFLWAAHPLLSIRQGMRIEAPPGVAEIAVSYSAGGRLGTFGGRNGWPIARTPQGPADISVIGPPSERCAEKFYFCGPLAEGRIALVDPAAGEVLRFVFPKDKVPYLAVWINNGGYGGGERNLALEPATGWLDDLAYAYGKRQTSVLPPNGAYEWFIEAALA